MRERDKVDSMDLVRTIEEALAGTPETLTREELVRLVHSLQGEHEFRLQALESQLALSVDTQQKQQAALQELLAKLCLQAKDVRRVGSAVGALERRLEERSKGVWFGDN